ALKEFSIGQTAHMRLDDVEATPHLKKATELDPNFATAHAVLGVVYGNNLQNTPALDSLRKAFELKDRATDVERFYIESHYYDQVTGESLKAIATYEQWIKTYPRDTTPLDNVCLLYMARGQYDKALVVARTSLQLDPQNTYPYDRLGGIFMATNRF